MKDYRDARGADLMRANRSASKERDERGAQRWASPDRTHYLLAMLVAPSSNVSDAQKLAHSAPVPADAGIICTALINHIPPGRKRNRTRPSLSVRATCFSEGFRRFIATTSAPASGRFSYVKRTGSSSPARI